MQNPGSVTFLVLFAVTTLAVYLAVRRNWLSVVNSAAIGAVAASLSFILFSLSEGNMLSHALVVGVLLGVLFTGMTVTMASFFKTNTSSARRPADPPPPLG